MMLWVLNFALKAVLLVVSALFLLLVFAIFVALPRAQRPFRKKLLAFRHFKELFPTVRHLLWHLSMLRDEGNGLKYEVNFSNMCVGECMRKIRRGLLVEQFGTQPVFVVFRADHVEEVLNNSKNLTKGPVYKMITPWLGRGLLTSDGPEWRARRKLLTSSFHFRILQAFAEKMNEHASLFVDRIERKAPEENLTPYIEAFTLDVVCETIMGVPLGCQTSDSGRHYLERVQFVAKQLLKRYTYVWGESMFQRTQSGKDFQKAVQSLHEFSTKIVNDRKEELLRNPEALEAIDRTPEGILGSKKPFLDILLAEHLNHGSLSLTEIRNEVDTFLFGGHDTTSVGLQWALHFIGYHPEVQRKLHEEIDRVVGEDGTVVSVDQLKELTYLDMVLKESQRICPSAPMFTRRITEEIFIEGKPVPVGSEVVIFSMVLHRNPDVFPKPEEFDPERFSIDNSRHRHPYAYIPFSAGPRNCIGQKFAMLEEKILLVWVLRRFRLKSLDHRDQIPLHLELVLRPSSPIRVLFARRKAS